MAGRGGGTRHAASAAAAAPAVRARCNAQRGSERGADPDAARARARTRVAAGAGAAAHGLPDQGHARQAVAAGAGGATERRLRHAKDFVASDCLIAWRPLASPASWHPFTRRSARGALPLPASPPCEDKSTVAPVAVAAAAGGTVAQRRPVPCLALPLTRLHVYAVKAAPAAAAMRPAPTRLESSASFSCSAQEPLRKGARHHNHTATASAGAAAAMAVGSASPRLSSPRDPRRGARRRATVPPAATATATAATVDLSMPSRQSELASLQQAKQSAVRTLPVLEGERVLAGL